MADHSAPSLAHATAKADGEVLEVSLTGTWQITAARPSWTDVLGNQNPSRVRLRVDEVGKWDSSLLLFLFGAQQWCRVTGAYCDTDALPEKIRTLLVQLAASHETSVPFDRSQNFLVTVGLATQDVIVKAQAISRFVGECVLSAGRLVREPGKFRWRDCLVEMQQCGAMALPIVGLISFLVGVTLAYTGALVLRQYGGDMATLKALTDKAHLPYLAKPEVVKFLKDADPTMVATQLHRLVIRGDAAGAVMVNTKPMYSTTTIHLVREDGVWKMCWP